MRRKYRLHRFLIVTALIGSLLAAYAPQALSWTDTIIANSTKVRKAHVDELRSAINIKRQTWSLSLYVWSDPTITANSTRVKVAHIQEMRTAIGTVYTAGGQAVPTWTDTLIANVTKIRTIHITQLRQAVDNAPSVPACTWAAPTGQCGTTGPQCPGNAAPSGNCACGTYCTVNQNTTCVVCGGAFFDLCAFTSTYNCR